MQAPLGQVLADHFVHQHGDPLAKQGQTPQHADVVQQKAPLYRQADFLLGIVQHPGCIEHAQTLMLQQCRRASRHTVASQIARAGEEAAPQSA